MGGRRADVWRTSAPLGIVAAPSESRALPGASPPPTPPRAHDSPRRRRRAAATQPAPLRAPHSVRTTLAAPGFALRRAICPTIIAPRAKRTARRRSSMRCAPWWRRCEGILPRSGPSSGPTRRPCTSRRGPRRPRRMRLYPPCPACDHVFRKLLCTWRGVVGGHAQQPGLISRGAGDTRLGEGSGGLHKRRRLREPASPSGLEALAASKSCARRLVLRIGRRRPLEQICGQ